MNGELCADAALAGYWYAVARSDAVHDEPAAVRLLARDIVLWRTADGAVTAAPDRCPHREAPLSAGTVADGCLRCPYHGWTFGDEGRCVLVPSANDGVPIPPRAHLSTVRCTERYGLVWVCLGEPAVDIPTLGLESLERSSEFRRINTPAEIWRTSAPRMTDNFLDIAHFPFVHAGSFGRAQETRVPKVELEALDDEFFGYRYEVDANNSDAGVVASGQAAEVVHRRMTTGFQLPFTVRSTIEYDSGLQHVLLLLTTPVDDVTSLFTFVVWRNDDFDVSAEEIIRFDLGIGAEDKLMLEKIPGPMPLVRTSLVSVQADRCSVEWRRRLAMLLSDGTHREV